MSATGPLPPSAAARTTLPRHRPEGYFGGIRLLASDARVATLLLDDARRRSMERLFGIPRDEKSGLVILIALLTLSHALQSRVPNRPTRPSVSGVAFGFGALRETAYDVAGPRSRETPYFGALLAFALFGASTRFAVRGATHRGKAACHDAYTGFHHRYGHLIRPNRRRDR